PCICVSERKLPRARLEEAGRLHDRARRRARRTSGARAGGSGRDAARDRRRADYGRGGSAAPGRYREAGRVGAVRAGGTADLSGTPRLSRRGWRSRQRRTFFTSERFQYISSPVIISANGERPMITY